LMKLCPGCRYLRGMNFFYIDEDRNWSEPISVYVTQPTILLGRILNYQNATMYPALFIPKNVFGFGLKTFNFRKYNSNLTTIRILDEYKGFLGKRFILGLFKAIIDTFTQTGYTLDFSAQGNGTVSTDPWKYLYENDEIVTLTAMPNIYWTFDHWSGDLNGSANPATITINSNKQVTAVFTHTTPDLTCDAHGPYTGEVDADVLFTGTAVGGIAPYDWLWNFGDGNTSTSQNPTHAYTQSGIYNVTLTVFDTIYGTANDIATAIIT
jgi:hypothetical protein